MQNFFMRTTRTLIGLRRWTLSLIYVVRGKKRTRMPYTNECLNRFELVVCIYGRRSALISLRISAGWSGPSLFAYGISRECPDQNAQIHMLSWTYVVRILHKDPFRTLRIIISFFHPITFFPQLHIWGVSTVKKPSRKHAYIKVAPLNPIFI